MGAWARERVGVAEMRSSSGLSYISYVMLNAAHAVGCALRRVRAAHTKVVTHASVLLSCSVSYRVNPPLKFVTLLLLELGGNCGARCLRSGSDGRWGGAEWCNSKNDLRLDPGSDLGIWGSRSLRS